jgi:hypothetical protein
MNAVTENVKYIEDNLKIVLQNPYVMTVLKISLVLYASQIAPTLPVSAQALLKNTFFKIFAITLIAYFAELDFQLSIILAIIYVISTNLMSGRGFFESYSNTNLESLGPYYTDNSKYQTLLGTPATIGSATLLDSMSDNYSGCDNIKMADLLAMFDNDALKLQNTVMYSFNELIKQLPPNSDAMSKLVTIAKAVGIPGNIKFEDSSAGLLASILIQVGFNVTKLCQPPSGDGMINI